MANVVVNLAPDDEIEVHVEVGLVLWHFQGVVGGAGAQDKDPENISVNSLESGENVIEFLFWGCLKKFCCFVLN